MDVEGFLGLEVVKDTGEALLLLRQAAHDPQFSSGLVLCSQMLQKQGKILPKGWLG